MGFTNKLAASQIMGKASCCFICGQQFEFADLSEHEKLCLQSIQSNDVQFTQQHTDEQTSTISSKADSLNLSNNSGSSSDSYEKKFLKCYICGSDVPVYLKEIHEKSCKKNWETGLIDTHRKTSVRSDMFRSLSRGSSRNDLNSEKGYIESVKGTTKLPLRGSCGNISVHSPGEKDSSAMKTPSKWKSATNLRKSSLELNVPRTPSDRERSNSATTYRYNRSHSISTTKQNGLSGSKGNLATLSKAKSLQDLRKTSPGSPSSEKKKGVSNPQYVVCHLCGKLYSQHSIGIHVKKCEKTYALQKEAGTNSNYKTKSKSLADLRKVGRSRQNSLKSPVDRPASGNKNRPSSMILTHRLTSAAEKLELSKEKRTFSSSTDNLLAISSKGESGKKSSNEVESKNVIEKRTDMSKDNHSAAMSPGLQKCKLCGQMYGTRSLPIHQKQCLIKWQREREEEVKQKKQKPKRDIQLMPFGRSKFPENQVNASPTRSSPIIKPSQVFGVNSPVLKSADDLFGDFELFKSEKDKENNIDGDLVTCEVCDSEFLSVDLKKHRMYCRVTTL